VGSCAGAFRDRITKDSWALRPIELLVPIPRDSMLTEGTLTPVRRIARSIGSSDAPQDFFGAPAPSSSISHEPLDWLSTRRGLRKPRASNSAGAASNGAQVVVFEAHSSAKTATSFRKGRLQLPPDDSIPNRRSARRDWATRACWPSGEQRNALETVVGAQNDTVCDAHGQGQFERTEPVSRPTRLRGSERNSGHLSESGWWWP
jgi:hypothetical protein